MFPLCCVSLANTFRAGLLAHSQRGVVIVWIDAWLVFKLHWW
jgi:hypothetical protein